MGLCKAEGASSVAMMNHFIDVQLTALFYISFISSCTHTSQGELNSELNELEFKI